MFICIIQLECFLFPFNSPLQLDKRQKHSFPTGTQPMHRQAKKKKRNQIQNMAPRRFNKISPAQNPHPSPPPPTPTQVIEDAKAFHFFQFLGNQTDVWKERYGPPWIGNGAIQLENERERKSEQQTMSRRSLEGLGHPPPAHHPPLHQHSRHPNRSETIWNTLPLLQLQRLYGPRIGEIFFKKKKKNTETPRRFPRTRLTSLSRWKPLYVYARGIFRTKMTI